MPIFRPSSIEDSAGQALLSRFKPVVSLKIRLFLLSGRIPPATLHGFNSRMLSSLPIRKLEASCQLSQKISFFLPDDALRRLPNTKNIQKKSINCRQCIIILIYARKQRVAPCIANCSQEDKGRVMRISRGVFTANTVCVYLTSIKIS